MEERSKVRCVGAFVGGALVFSLFQGGAAMAQYDPDRGRAALSAQATTNTLMIDSPVSFPATGALPARFVPDILVQEEPAETNYFIFASPCRSLAQIERIQTEMPAGHLSPPAPDWGPLMKTRRLLVEGGELRVLALGDSIINDTMRSGWIGQLQATYPKARIQAHVYVRGGGGCQHYRLESRVALNVLPRKPHLVLIGGISQEGVEPIRAVIRQLREGLPEVEILLMSGAFGGLDARDPKALAQGKYSGIGVYGKALEAVAEEERCAYLDMTAPWAEYIRSSQKHPHLFQRDRIHANEYGEQILGKIMMAFWTAPCVPKKAVAGPWPAGASPVEVGTRVTERFLALPHSQYGRPGNPNQITYPDVCTWHGCLTFAQASRNLALQRRLAARFEPLFLKDAGMIPLPDHVDNTVFGVLPLELYRQTGEVRYLYMGRYFAEHQWILPEGKKHETPEAKANVALGLSWQTRYWIDDMYMINAIQSQAFRATGETAYLERAALETTAYLDKLQCKNGLFYHAPEAPFHWGRGNGWMAAGMTEFLRVLPPSHPRYPRILEGYRSMMASLLSFQAEDGMWRQLVDDPASWKETSGTGMFAYAMITGVQRGWLDSATYGPAARRAWLALVTYMDENGDVREVCAGTNQNADRQHYLDRPRNTGNLHGQAPLVWCATALLGTKIEAQF